MCNTMSWNIICFIYKNNEFEKIILGYSALCQMQEERLMQRIKNVLCNELIVFGFLEERACLFLF